MRGPFSFLRTLAGRAPVGRQSAPVARSLDAAGGGRRWADDRRIGTPQALAGDAGTIARRAEHFAVNTALGARIADVLVGNLIGTGIIPRSRHPDPTTRRALQDGFDRWSDRADGAGIASFYSLQAQAARDLVIYGEAVFLWSTDESGTLVLRRFHPDQLARDVTRQTTGGTTAIVAGIEFDAAGRRIAYHIRPRSDLLHAGIAPPQRIAAENVLHVFREAMPGQVRGLSWLAPILLTAKDFDALADAMLTRAKVAALHAGFIVDPQGVAAHPGDADGDTFNASLEPGALVHLPPGRSIELPPVPSQDGALGLMERTLQVIAAGVGLTFEQLTGDFSKSTYSSARSGMLEFRRSIEAIQHNVIVPQFCAPVWRRFIGHAVLSGQIDADDYAADPSAFDRATWLPPKWAWVDPAKDAAGIKTALEIGVMSRAEAVAERGYDIEDVDAERAADAARETALGLTRVPSPPTAPDEEENP
jgi:lambda family phage portal protein